MMRATVGMSATSILKTRMTRARRFQSEGIAPLEHNVDLDAGEQRADAFLKINPMGRSRR